MEGIEKIASQITCKDNYDCNSWGKNIKKICDVLQELCSKLSNLEFNKCSIEKLRKKIEETMKPLLKFPRWELIEWVEDVRVFLQYLQHRMDFLALISTEWPKWTFSAWLMKDVMYYFLKQRVLLDGIGRSEELRGYYYEYKVMPPKEGTPIKFHIIKIKDKSVWEEKNKKNWEERKKQLENKAIFLLNSEKDGKVNLKENILVAIPGGIVGYHAFFVILENIIRNAAKHSFSKKKHEVFNIIIEVIDDPYKPDEEWRFRIYDNVSKVCKGCKCKKNREDKKRIGPVIDDKVEKPEDCLVAYMNKALRQPLLKETGEVNRSNWGMAEIKIAATYLQQRDVSVLGEGGDKITGKGEEKEDFIIRAICSPIETLGYEFKIPKPKEVGIVCKKEK